MYEDALAHKSNDIPAGGLLNAAKQSALSTSNSTAVTNAINAEVINEIKRIITNLSLSDDNNKQLVTSPNLDEANNYFISEGNTQGVILSKIEKQRQESCGNYDGFLGYVTNFTWTYRKDGGYDITLHARSAGDVIESIKLIK